MLPCENVTVGPKEVTTRFFTWSCISCLGGPRQVVCCHAKISQLAWRKWRQGPLLDFDKFLGQAKTSRMLPCEDVAVGPKEVMTRSFTWSWSVPWAGQDKLYVAMRRCLRWPKRSDDAILHMRCYERGCRAKMTRLAQRKSLGEPRQVVRCWNVDKWIKAMCCVNSLIP
jgi:hypothetical protein